MKHFIIAAVCLLGTGTSWAAADWHQPLSLANQGYWPQRVRITVENVSDEPLAGTPVEVNIAALADARVESLRVCDPEGVEYLFDLRDTTGRVKRSGRVAAGDRLIVPAVCAPRATSELFVYAGNAEAWPVPDYLPGGLINGGFEFVYYISDEPHFDHDFVVDQMQRLCTLIHDVDPDLPIYSSTWRHCAAWDESLDIWGVGQYGCFPVAEMQRQLAAGKQLWFTCDGQMATDTPLLATERLLPYYCFKHGAAGFEFWGVA